MPTGPRHSGIVATASSLLVLPVRIFRMFYVPQRPTAGDDRDCGEGVLARRRRRGPLQRPRVPWVVSGCRAFEVGPEKVRYPTRDSDDLEHHADGDDQIPEFPATAGVVRVDAARHAENSRDVHEIKREVEADEEQPE